jgi:hypothetical protein
MSRAEAEKWAENSVVRETVSHVTIPQNAKGIKQDGFDVNRVAVGRVWGNGVYVGLDDQTADFYKEMYTTKKLNPNDEEPVSLRIQLNVKNVYTVDVSSYDEYNTNRFESIVSQLPDGTQRFKEIKAEIANEGKINTKSGVEREAITRILQQNNYDALKIVDSKFRYWVGGNQMIVFDPRNVTVIDGD